MKDDAFSLIEVTVAVTILGVVMIPISLMIMQFVRSTAFLDSQTTAMSAANAKLAEINYMPLPWEDTYPNYQGRGFDIRVSRSNLFSWTIGSAIYYLYTMNMWVYPSGSDSSRSVLSLNTSIWVPLLFGKGSVHRLSNIWAYPGTVVTTPATLTAVQTPSVNTAFNTTVTSFTPSIWTSPGTIVTAPNTTGSSGVYGGAQYENTYYNPIQRTSDGGYIMVGSTTSFGAGNYDIYVVKMDSGGGLQWSKAYGTFYADYGNAIQQTSDGGYIIAGYTATSPWNNRAYLIKTTPSGNEQWSTVFYGGYNSTSIKFNCVQRTSDEGYIMGGNITVNGNQKTFLMKTTYNGTLQWSKHYIEFAELNAIQQTSDGGYIMAGDTYNALNDNMDAYALKVNSNGNRQWGRYFGGPAGFYKDEYIYSVQQTSDGGYIMAGSTSYGGGSSAAYVVRLTSAGTIGWDGTTRAYNTISRSAAYSVKEISYGGYIIAGYTSGSYGDDYYLVKIDLAGSHQWSKAYGGSRRDTAQGVQQTSEGGYILGGTTYSFGAGGSDFYAIKTDAAGNVT